MLCLNRPRARWWLPSGWVLILAVCAGLAGLTPTASAAEDFSWARRISDTGTGTEVARGIAVDGNGDILVMGEYTGTTNFGAAGNLTATGRDLYVAKMDRLGNFIWAVRVGGDNDEYCYQPNCLAVGPGNNIYITGRFTGNNFSVAGSATINATGAVDPFIAMLNPNGVPQWVNHPIEASGTLSGRGRGICVDSGGNCYVFGHFSGGDLSFATTPTATVLAPSGQDIWVAKLDITGVPQWAVKAGGTGADDGNAIALAPGGSDPYICGWTASTNAAFAPLVGTLSTAGGDDVMVAKLDGSNGDFLYAILGGGTGADQGLGICVDSSDRATVAGSFTGTATFGTAPNLVASGTGLDACVVRLNAAGSDFSWAVKAGANNADDRARAILIDGGGNLAVAGDCSNNAAFGALPAVTAAGSNAFIARLDPTGPTWLVARGGGGTGTDAAETIAQAGTATIFAGEYAANATFGSTPTLALSNATDVFVTKFAPVVKGVSVVQTGGNTAVTEGGATDTYAVALDAQPSANVTITPTPGAGATVAPPTLTFTTVNWSTPQTITVTAVNDAFAQGAHNSTITHAATSTDLAYDAIGVASVVAAITDNDAAGVTVTPGTLTLDEGAVGTTRTVDVHLNSQPMPAQVVVIDLTSNTTQGFTLSTNQLTFTNADWSTDQTVTVTVVEDAIVESNPHNRSMFFTINNGATTANEYDSLAIPFITYAITDNDTAGVTIVQSGGSTDVTEGGASDSYTIVLTSQPTNDVTITVTPDASTNVSGGPWVFTAADWFTAQTVTVTAVDTGTVEGNHTSPISHSAASVDPVYNAGQPVIANVTVNVTDDETAGITVTPGTLSLDEAAAATTDSFSIVLDAQPPPGLVAVIDLTSDTSKGVTLSSSQLTFTDGNWNTPQNVTVTVVNDSIAETNPHNSNVTLAVNNGLTTANAYDSYALPTQTYAIADNDPVGVTVTPGTLTLDENAVGTTRTFDVRINSQPQTGQVVQIDLGSDTTTGVTLDQANLTFTDADWSVDQTVTVTVVDDAVAEANPHNSDVTLTVNNAATTANEYDGYAIANIGYSITDNDAVGVTIVQSGGSTDVNEAGATNDSFTMKLNSQPTNSVTIAFTTDTVNGVTASASLTFTTANWATTQTVTVTAVDDSAIETNPHIDNVAFTLTSVDGSYNGFAVPAVAVNITDNDAPTIVLTLTGGTNAVTEGGATDSLDVRLGSQPVVGDDPVTVTFSCSVPGRVTFSPLSMNFVRTGGNWNTNQTLTITAVDDLIAQGTQAYTITATAASSILPPSGYNGASSNTSVTVTDDDVAGVVVTGTPTINEGPPLNTGSVQIRLSSQPTGNVTVTPVSADTVTGLTITSAAMVFTPVNWATNQTVNFTAVQDGVDEGVSQVESVNLNYSGADAIYNALSAGSFNVTVNDDDTAGFVVGSSGAVLDEAKVGQTRTFTIRLQTQPAAGQVVVIDLLSDATMGVSLSSNQLTFTNANWNINQAVIVTVINDDYEEGPHSDTVTRTVNAGLTTANEYDGLLLGSLNYTLYDNDQAGVQFTTTKQQFDRAFTADNPSGQTHTTTVDRQGNIYMAGYFTSTMTFGSTVLTTIGGADLYIAKFNPDGSLAWARGYGGTSSERILDLAVDPAGNLYCTGQWQGTMSFAPLAPQVATGSFDVFVGKVDPANGDFVWATSAGDVDTSTIGWGLAADGNAVYVTGEFAGKPSWPGQGALFISQGTDAFIGKLDSTTGLYQWVQYGGGPNSDNGTGIAVNQAGLVFATGYYYGFTPPVQFGPYLMPFGNSSCGYLAVLDANGNFIDVQGITSSSSASCVDVAVDAKENAYVYGTLNVDATLGAVNLVTATNGTFLAQYSLGAMNFNWGQVLNPASFFSPTRVLADAAGNTTMTGYGSGPLNVPGLGAVGGLGENLFILQADNIGDFQWALAGVALSSNTASDIAAEPNGNWVVAGDQSGSGSFGPLTVAKPVAGPRALRIAAPVGTVEAGTTDSFNVVLTSQPTAAVTVNLVTDSQQTLSVPSVNFTTGNWNLPQAVTVTAVNDAIAENSPHMGYISSTVSSTDTRYSSLGGGRCGNQITDNDLPGVSTTESGGSTDVTETGITDSYSVVLISQPTQDVTITLSYDAAQITPDQTVLTFTSVNWATPQVVTITAVDDPLIEAAVHAAVITQTATSADPFYSGIAVASVTVNITDNDVAGVTVTESGGTTDVTEGGATDTYTLVLTAQPTGPVTVNISATGGQTSTNVPSVVFTAATWNTPQTITVTAVDDMIDEVSPNTGLITHTTASLLDPNFNGLAVASVTPNVTDNDVAGVTVTQSAGSTDVTEGGATDTFTVILDTQPVADVTVTISTDAQTSASSASVTFTTANWNIAQAITMTAVNDLVDEVSPHSSTITLANTSVGDPFYNAAGIIEVDTVTTDTITANVTDNDSAAVILTPTLGSTDIVEGGATDTYNVRLATQPTQDVTITLTPDSQATPAPLTLTFTSVNWASGQAVTVTAVDDNVAEGAHTSTITHAATSFDGFYSGIAVANVVANITDNDFPNVVITPSGSSTDVTEGGATDTYTVQLATQPTATVTVTVTPNAQVTVDQPTLTFDNTTWSTPQTITVTAVDDLVAESSPHPGLVTHASASADSFYGGLAVPSMPVSITDNDIAGVTVTQSGASTDVVEGGATDDFTVVLDTMPMANVTVNMTTADGQTTVSPPSLLFTPANYLTPQTVTVTAVLELPTVVIGANSPPEAPMHAGMITFSSTSGDSFYAAAGIFMVDSVPTNTVTANITDKSIKVLSPGFGQSTAIDSAAGALTRASGAVTVTTLTAHLLTTGQVVIIAGADDGGFDGTYTVTGTPGATTFTYAQPSLGDATSQNGTAAASAPEVYNAGSTRSINWQFSGGVANVELQFSASGTFIDTVSLGTFAANSNPQPFTVPMLPAANARIRVVDSVNPTVFGESAAFAIVVPSLQMLSPNGGETFNMGDLTTVAWNSIGNIPTVNVEISSEKTFTITTNGIQRSSGVVTVTTTANHSYSVGDEVIVTNVTNTSFNGVFPITATSPNTFQYSQVGGDTISSGGETLVLVWTAIPSLTGIPNTGSVSWTVESPGTVITAASRATNLVTITTATATKIQVGDSVLIKGVADSSFNGTQTVTVVISPTQFSILQTGPNATSSGGTVHESSQTVRLRVSDPSQPTLNDHSDNNFSIFNPGIFIITPNGGETINRNSNFLIQWLTIPTNASIPNVDIEVSTDGGATWSSYAEDNSGNPAANINNNGSFLWNVNQSATQNAKVRVRNSAGGLGIGISVAPFTILGVFNLDQTLLTLDPVVKSSGFDPDLTPVLTFTLTTEENWALVNIDPLTSQFSDFPWLQVRQTDASNPFYGAAPGQGTVGVSHPLYSGSNPSYVLGDIDPTLGVGADRTSNVVTITTTTAHGYQTGDKVFIADVNDASFNSPAGTTFTITSVPTPTTFTYAKNGPNATSEDGTTAIYPHGIIVGQQAITFQVAMDPGNLPEGDYVGLVRLRGLNTNAERLVVVRGTVTDAFRVHVPIINKDLISSDFQGTVKYEMLQNFRGTLPPFDAQVQNLSKLDKVTFSTNATTNTAGQNWLEVNSEGSGWVTSLPSQTTFPVPIQILAANGAVRVANSVTITTVAAHNYSIGDTVTISGVADNSFDGTFTVTAIAATAFTYGQTGPDANSGGGEASIGNDRINTTVRINQAQLPTAAGIYTGQVIFSSITGETRVINVSVNIKSTTPKGKTKSGCAIEGTADTAMLVWLLGLGLLALGAAGWTRLRDVAATR